MEKKESKISNVEWALVIGALFTIDAIQIAIEWLLIWFGGISILINFIIDLLVGMSLALYLQLRGESLANPKRLFGLLATFGLEMFPGVSELPLWGLDGIFNMFISKSNKIVSKVPGSSKVLKFVSKASGLKNSNESKDNDMNKAA